MPKPKDTKEGCCVLCGKYVREEEYFHQCSVVEAHYPGCHKVHLECANKKIEEVRSFLESHYWDCYCDGDGYDPQCGQHGDGAKWLESLGDK